MRRFSLLPKTPQPAAVFDHQRLMALVNSMSDAFLAIDSNGKITISNSSALSLLDTNSLDGKMVADVLELIDKRHQPVNISNTLLKDRKAYSSRDLSLKYSDGSLINLFLSSTRVYTGYNRRSGGSVILMRDITDEKSLEDERTEFISVASHELRTPIAIAEGGIGNALFLAQQAKSSGTLIQNLTAAHDQVMFLSNLINDLAMLSKAERGKYGLIIEKIDIARLVREVAANYKNQFQAKGLELHVSIDSSSGKPESSKLYVQEILQNFLTNSIKYTEKGSTTLSAGPSDGGVLITVADTGIGISKGDQEKVFGKFFRSNDSRVSRTNGTGLGLYVSLKLAKQIGARINMESQLDHGSKFSLYLPLDWPAATGGK